MEGAHHLAAELHDPPVLELELLDPPADAVARLQHEDVGARRREVACGREAAEPGAQDDDVVAAHARTASALSPIGSPSSPSQPRLAISLITARRWISLVPSQIRSTRSSR